MSAIKPTVIIVVVTAIVVMAGVAAWRLTPRWASQRDAFSSGKAVIGGSFTLLNTDGDTVTAADFRGRYMLVYFGYTHCPDVCPTTLMNMARALDCLAEKASKKAKVVVPIFISVDPARDTVQVVREYVAKFHSRMVGLTGSRNQVSRAAQAYRIYSKKAEAGHGPDEYLVDHSSYIYLIAPDGDYITHFDHGTTPKEMSRRLSHLVRK